MVVHYVLVSMYFQIEFNTSIQEILFIIKNREDRGDNNFRVGPKIIGPPFYRQFLFSVVYEPRTLANDHIVL